MTLVLATLLSLVIGFFVGAVCEIYIKQPWSFFVSLIVSCSIGYFIGSLV